MKQLLFCLLCLRVAFAQPAELARGNNRFAQNLYQRLAHSKGNVFFSPFSISSALSMTAAGARGQTAAEMAKVLQLPARPGQAWRKLLLGLDGPQLKVANRLWIHRKFAVSTAFLGLARRDYQAGMEKVDFGRSEVARLLINGWVEKATGGKISNLIPGGVLNGSTRLMLTNAIYFKGEWQHGFLAAATRAEPFTSADGRKQTCQLMHQQADYALARVGSVQVLELPYQGERLSLTILLPQDGKGLARLEAERDWSRYFAALSGLQPVEVSLPRFKVEAQFNLNEVLKQMGMRLVFAPDQSDLSGLGSTAEGRLYISHVLHKAFIEVNEKGTEAAAATAVVVGREGRAAHPQPQQFRADHAFLYAIRDRQTGSLLFLGRLDHP